MSQTESRFPVPPGTQTVDIRIIDSTTSISNLQLSIFMKPPLKGLEYLPPLPSWSFLIEHPSGKKLLYDLGVAKTWREFPPAAAGHIESLGWEVKVEKEVVDVLTEYGIDAGEIDAVIWSHWHWDHTGNPSRFPGTTELVVGPGFKEALLPGYPEKQESPIRQVDLAGRILREIDFEKDSVQIGRFRGHDFFGDGSFYLINTPGHAVGHLGALARTTTNPDTFIFMGGDLCHHSGEIRPSPHLRIPQEIPITSAGSVLPCPGSAFEGLQIHRQKAPDEPFFEPAMGLDIPLTIDTIRRAQDADAESNVWFVYAHDPSLYGVVDFFPWFANDWMAKGWRERTLWAFLRDFEGAVLQQ